jgi:hypothetical protein
VQQVQFVSKYNAVRTKVTTCKQKIESREAEATKNSAEIDNFNIKIQVNGFHLPADCGCKQQSTPSLAGMFCLTLPGTGSMLSASSTVDVPSIACSQRK